MKKNKSSIAWLLRQKKDIYVKKAIKNSIRSRAWFKIQEIHSATKKLWKSGVYIDLGSAPGGWSQYLTSNLPAGSRIIACDRLHMDHIRGVEFIHGDFLKEETIDKIRILISNEKVRFILSDLSPNITGNNIIDQNRSFELNQSVLRLCKDLLGLDGNLLIKTFVGEEWKNFLNLLSSEFKNIRAIKPKSSRVESKEVYLICTDYIL